MAIAFRGFVHWLEGSDKEETLFVFLLHIVSDLDLRYYLSEVSSLRLRKELVVSVEVLCHFLDVLAKVKEEFVMFLGIDACHHDINRLFNNIILCIAEIRCKLFVDASYPANH